MHIYQHWSIYWCACKTSLKDQHIYHLTLKLLRTIYIYIYMTCFNFNLNSYKDIISLLDLWRQTHTHTGREIIEAQMAGKTVGSIKHSEA